MKKILNGILFIIVIVGLVLTGVSTIKSKTSVSEKESSYTLTTFDYVILSPSGDQVTELKNKTNIVSEVFPCVCFNAPLIGNHTTNVDLLLSDKMDVYSISLFNDNTLISGKYEENTILLDKTAATNLNVVVGDTVKVTLGIRTYSLKVSAIYMASTYTNLDKGLALAKLTDEIKSGYEVKLTYDYAFVDAKDVDKCAEELKTYKPLGKLQTFEDYMAEEKSKNTCPPTLTEEEWDAAILTAYNEYKDTFLSQNFESSVQDKKIFMEDVKEQVATLNNKINYFTLSIAIAVIVIYIILSIVFIYSNKQDDIQNIKQGTSNNKIAFTYCSIYAIGTVIIAGISFLILYLYARKSIFISQLMGTICLFSLPILASLVVLIPFILIYVNNLDNFSSKNDTIELDLQPKTNSSDNYYPTFDTSYVPTHNSTSSTLNRNSNSTLIYFDTKNATTIGSVETFKRYIKHNVIVSVFNGKIQNYYYLNKTTYMCRNTLEKSITTLTIENLNVDLKQNNMYVYKPINKLTEEECKLIGIKKDK